VIGFLEYYKNKGHVFGECMSHPDHDLMYVNIPKNASSWTKPNLLDWNWENYNYHTDNLYHKHAIVVLRDPVERWLSGIAEYMFLYHRHLEVNNLTTCFLDIIFDRIAFDDHTEQQVLFLEKLNLKNCTFFLCNQFYRDLFSKFLNTKGMTNRYYNYEYQHVTEKDSHRKKFKQFFTSIVEKNSKYHNNLKSYFSKDYQLINSINFYAG
jgi:hypothetical protein